LNWLEKLNGTILRGLAVFGALAIAAVGLMILNWTATAVFGYDSGLVLETMVSLSVLMFAGGAGVKYASGHTVNKKETEDE